MEKIKKVKKEKKTVFQRKEVKEQKRSLKNKIEVFGTFFILLRKKRTI